MSDDTKAMVLAAIGEGYAVEQDPKGRFRFFIGEDLEIVWRNSIWVARDGVYPDRTYASLMAALPYESWLLNENSLDFDSQAT